jgi:hypothetical protein
MDPAIDSKETARTEQIGRSENGEIGDGGETGEKERARETLGLYTC